MMMRIKLGGTVLIVLAALGIVFFTLAIPVDLYYFEMGPAMMADPGFLMPFVPWDVFDWRWAVAIPVYGAIVLLCGVLIWMGGKMVTTPASRPGPMTELAEGRES